MSIIDSKEYAKARQEFTTIDKPFRVTFGSFNTVFDQNGQLSIVLNMTGMEAEVFKRICAKNSGITIDTEKEKI